MKISRPWLQWASVSSLCVVLTGCAAARKEFSPSECNEQSGYERGFIEGKDGRNPDSDYVDMCREDLRDGVRKGYRQGYDKGRPEYLANMERMRQESLQLQQARIAAQASQRLPLGQGYRCVLPVMSDRFEGYGMTEAAARSASADHCRRARGQNALFCAESSSQCALNR